MLRHLVDFSDVSVAARRDGFRAGLNDVELAVETILGPFDVHGAARAGFGAIVLFDLDRLAGERQRLFVGDAEFLTFLGVGGNVARRRPAPIRKDHPDFFGAQRALQNSALALPIGGLEDVKFVGVDRALHDVFAKAVGAGEEDNVLESAFGVDREDDAGRRQIRAHHFHHADGVEHFEVIESIVDAIADGAVGEEARKAMADRVENGGGAAHIEIGVMLSGETRARQIFRRRRRAHRDRQIGSIFVGEAG
ncbi:MAG: Uncharacterized protein FD148_906 [Methylocystaceae bacterium]|nr:MAG: Uncharacterized protein FD148_906 [Methylocystaceae bacterium]